VNKTDHKKGGVPPSVFRRKSGETQKKEKRPDSHTTKGKKRFLVLNDWGVGKRVGGRKMFAKGHF